MIFGKHFEAIKQFYARNERRITPVAFFGGFVWDNLTLRVDLWFQNLQFLIYLIIAGATILFINAHDAGKVNWRFAAKFSGFTPLLFQFIFGGLFSAFLVFYARSASFVDAWPFLLFIAFFFVGNEVFKKKYARLTFQMSVFFIALFSYTVFALPILIGRIGDLVFVASGTLALLGMGIIAYLFSRVLPERLHENRHKLAASIGGIYILFQVFYFTNIIPPIPLALKESGIYHSLEPAALDSYIYRIEYEPAPWYLFFKEQNDTFHLLPGEAIYSYSAVFAPTKFKIPILHRWMYFDEAQDEWVQRARIPFAIRGGRDGGYRGYTFKENIHAGKWRVEVITETGHILGRRNFRVVISQTPPKLEEGYR